MVIFNSYVKLPEGIAKITSILIMFCWISPQFLSMFPMNIGHFHVSKENPHFKPSSLVKVLFLFIRYRLPIITWFPCFSGENPNSILFFCVYPVNLCPDEIPHFCWNRWTSLFGYGSIPINTIFRGMNIHLPAILMWTTGVHGFDTLPFESYFVCWKSMSKSSFSSSFPIRISLKDHSPGLGIARSLKPNEKDPVGPVPRRCGQSGIPDDWMCMMLGYSKLM